MSSFCDGKCQKASLLIDLLEAENIRLFRHGSSLELTVMFQTMVEKAIHKRKVHMERKLPRCVFMRFFMNFFLVA